MSKLDFAAFSHWLKQYGSAWITGDAAAVVQLFSPDARYEETPFDTAMIGREAIFKYWKEGAGLAQKDIRFAYRVVTVQEDTGIAHWTASFLRVPGGTFVELDGILMAKFTQSDLCVHFREWWHRRETAPKIGTTLQPT